MIRTPLISILLSGILLCSDNVLSQPREQDRHHVEQYGIPFAGVPSRQDAVIYQVNMRAFSDRGDFAGVTARLDSIRSLGVNVIYLMPIYPIGVLNTANSPYCIRDYTSINAEFGNMNDLHALVNGAHERDMSVILDWVGNHTSWDHDWITTHKDWYKHDSMGKIVPPNPDWKDVAQLDYSNKDMRLTMIADMKYWVYAANIDGFRCDYADGPPVDFWRQAIDTLRNIHTHKLLMLAEGTRSGNYTAGFDYNFGFKFFQALETIYKYDKTAMTIDSLNISEYKDAADGQQVVRYTTNHDVNGSDGTPQELFGGSKGAMAAFAVAACMKGIPMVYNGQEAGMGTRIPFPFTTVKIKWDTDPATTSSYKRMIKFRNSSRAVRYGSLRSYTTHDICSFIRTDGSDTVFVVANVRNKVKHLNIPPFIAHTHWHNVMTGRSTTLGNTMALAPYQYIIFSKE